MSTSDLIIEVPGFSSFYPKYCTSGLSGIYYYNLQQKSYDIIQQITF